MFTLATTKDIYADPFEYAWEPHEVTTEDGYILTLFRIFKRDSPHPDNIVVYNFDLGFDETTLLETYVDFLPSNQKIQLFNIIDMGFDVWTNAFRGPQYNQGHVTLSTDSFEYWNFSLDEQGLYDLPAAVDYIYKQGNG